MDTRFQTSFIPKKNLVQTTRPSRGSSVSLFFVVSLVLFITAIALAAAVFLYQKSLVTNIKEMDAALVKARKELEPSFLAEAVKLSKRIEAAKTILDKHVAVTPLFEEIGKYTIVSVRFKDFLFDSDGSGEVKLSMSGEAKSFNSVAKQSDVFGKVAAFKNPVFSEFNLDNSGNVVFKFTASVDPKLLSYKNSIAALESATSTTPTKR